MPFNLSTRHKKMTAWRGRARSGEEPAAYRVVPQGEPTTLGSDWEVAAGGGMGGGAASSRYNSAALARDLSGASASDFDAYEFVRRLVAGSSGDGDGSLDADAALAALDGVEILLQRRRDIAVKDETRSRDELRHELHTAMRSRDEVNRAADAVASALPDGRVRATKAAKILADGVAPLAGLVQERARLVTARDLVRLLGKRGDGGGGGEGLGIVRASEILALMRREERGGTLNRVLDAEDCGRAVEELSRCENELAARLGDGLRKGGGLRECAIAAGNLGREVEFLTTYMDRMDVFAGDCPLLSGDLIERTDDASGSELIAVLVAMRWECTSALRAFLPVAFNSFPRPLEALSMLVNKLFHEKLVRTATHVLVTLREYAANVDHRARRVRESMEVAMDMDFGSGNLCDTGKALEMEVEAADLLSLDVRGRLVHATTGLIKTLTSALHELIEVCSSADVVPSKSFNNESILSVSPQARRNAALEQFSGTLTDLGCFVRRQLRNYAVLEKEWLEQKVEMAFGEVSKLDAYASQLTRATISDAEAYTRYRSKFSPTASAFVTMTDTAMGTTLECLRRASTMLMMSIQVGSLMGNGKLQGSEMIECDGFKEAGLGLDCLVGEGVVKQGDEDINSLMLSMVENVVQTYLGNCESILQAANHLIPTSEHSSAQHETWASGVSPLSTYIEAIGSISEADGNVDNMLAKLVLDDVTIEPLALAPVVNDVLSSMQTTVRSEARRELTLGLKRLALDIKLGVESALSAAGRRLNSILGAPGAFEAYCDGGDGEIQKRVSTETEPTMAFVTASIFIERQLQACRAALSRSNVEYVSVIMAEKVRDVVIEHWARCRGPFSKLGALLLMVNARSIVRSFAANEKASRVISVLSVLAQLHFDSGDEIWATLERGALANVGASAILKVLEKRADLDSNTVSKIKDVLLVSDGDDDSHDDDEQDVRWRLGAAHT